jgi:endonuclease/exonuclease/phosphatase family metal-dependent hydrolase
MVSRSRARAATIGVVVALAFGLAGTVAAKDNDKRQLTVYTQNLYLGSDLTNLIGASGVTFLINATQDWGRAKCVTRFDLRAAQLAAQIQSASPDVIALQEVTLWRSGPPDTLAGVRTPNATTIEMDFLPLLTTALAARGLHYTVGATTTNADVEGPTFTLDANCVPTNPTTDFTDIRLTDRDVILVKASDPDLVQTGSDHGHYAAQLSLPLGGGTAEFTRGWASVKLSFEGKRVRLFNTHLEVENPAAAGAVQVAQGNEAIAGPLATDDGAVIAVGDYNSAADGSTTATYGNLIASGLIDSWSVVHPGDPGLTCCHDQNLLEATASFGSRIDLVLSKGPIRALESTIVGSRYTPLATGLAAWPSDHAGVVTTFRLH